MMWRRRQKMTYSPLEAAILQTVAYVDMFDFPPTAAEIHRYLVGIKADRSEVEAALGSGRLVPELLEQRGEFFLLPGRDETVEIRKQRTEIAVQLWPIAMRYAKIIAGLPFVRMVAVTGSLAVNNVGREADIDYLIVTRTGRLWLCRAMVIVIVRLAARRGISLCPNYFLSERALNFAERNLYAAHELVQMVPLTGLDVYWRMRELNSWWVDYLPNAAGIADGPAAGELKLPRPARALRAAGEGLLGSRLGRPLERWEMNRKVGRFSRLADGREAAFSADWCKGHFDHHGQRAIESYNERWHALERERPEHGRGGQ
jgi:hypothetical protein